MKQCANVYLCNECFVAYPSSLVGKFGPWVAESPGIGLQSTAPDEAVGIIVRLLLSCSRNGVSMPAPNKVPFPLAKLAGVKNWLELARKSRFSVAVECDGSELKIVRSITDGAGYSGDTSFSSLTFPAAVSASDLGKAVRGALEQP